MDALKIWAPQLGMGPLFMRLGGSLGGPWECLLPWWLSDKESACNAGPIGDTGPIPGSGRSPGEGHGNPLQYSCLVNPMDRGAWRATVHGTAKNWTRLKRLSMKARAHASLLHGVKMKWSAEEQPQCCLPKALLPGAGRLASGKVCRGGRGSPVC